MEEASDFMSFLLGSEMEDEAPGYLSPEEKRNINLTNYMDFNDAEIEKKVRVR